MVNVIPGLRGLISDEYPLVFKEISEVEKGFEYKKIFNMKMSTTLQTAVNKVFRKHFIFCQK